MPDGPTVANSSCLIALEAAGYLHLLQHLYGVIEVPDAVAHECRSALPVWVAVHSVRDEALVRSLTLEVGAGEAEAIVLALEHSAARLILDDKKARRAARKLDLPVTGTLAVLLRAKELGIIPEVREAIDALMAKDFRISQALVDEVLRRAGE